MAETEYDFNNKTAVVTGASRGIGEAIARSLARHGATVVLSSRRQERLDKVAASINEQGAGRAIPIACHTGHTDAIEALFARVQAELGRLDVLVNNAATNPYFGPATGISESAFDKTLEVNIKGYFLMAQHAARMMTEQRSGSIIGMTKAAVISMTRGLARELGPFGVRVNAIAPGLTKTRFAGALFENPEIDLQTLHRADAVAPPCRAGGNRRRRAVPGLRGFQLHHRERDCVRRGNDGLKH